MLTWMLIDVHETGKPTLVGASTGLVVGLVAITPGTGFVPIWSSFLIGALVSPVCYFCVSRVKKKFGYDDALDAFGCHGVGGIYGGIMTGLFGSKAVNPALVSDGLVFGDTKLFLANLVGTVVTILLGLVGGGLCIFLTKRITPLRVSEKEEKIGLDITQHGERAYPSFNGDTMYKVEAIVREEKLEDVKEALVAQDIRGMTISQVMGCGVQMGFTELVRGNEIAVNMIPKIKFEILVSNEDWRDKAIEAIRIAAWTGEPGDGKIFTYKVDTAVRIRTGERDVEAVTPSHEGRDHNRRQKNTSKLNEKS